MHMFDLGGREEVLQVLSRHNIMPEQILVLDEKMSAVHCQTMSYLVILALADTLSSVIYDRSH